MLTKSDIEKIKESLYGIGVPIGTIIIFAGKNPPEGFVICDGRLVKKDLFPQLYATIGDTFGEEGDLFGVPDLRGRFVRGYDSANIIDPQRTFGDYQEDALQGHSHKTDWSSLETLESGDHFHYIHADHYDRIKDSYSSDKYVHKNADFNDQFNKKTNVTGKHRHKLPRIILGDICSNKYGEIKISTETRPKNISLNFCIKAK